MKKQKTKILLAVVLSLLFFSKVSAAPTTNYTNEYDSLYRYNALESKTSFTTLASNIGNIDDRFAKNNDSLLPLPSDETLKQLQEITDKQSISMEKTENAMADLRNRSELKNFLIGSNLGILKFQLMQIRGESSMLDALYLKTGDDTTRIQINDQIKLLKEEQTKVENFILEQENKFSLFGWLVNTL